MNIVNKVALRQLKQNKRRTLVTIIGVIISVAMLTAVATIGSSFIDFMKRQTIAETGEWHVQFQDVDQAQIDTIKKDKITDKLFLTSDLGFAYLPGAKETSKPYVFIRSFNKEGFENFPVYLKEGKLPTKPDEIIVSDSMLKYGDYDYQIGDQITLEVGERQAEDLETYPYMDESFSLVKNEAGEVQEAIVNTQEQKYTIVGISEIPYFEYSWAPIYGMMTYLDSEQLAANQQIDAAITVKKVTKDFFNDVERLATDIKADSYEENYNLMRYYGVFSSESMHTTMYSIVAIIMVIIIVGSVSLIYNAFAISVAERSRHLGMLGSVGATKQQKRNSVFYEGAIIGLISIPIGILAGIFGIYVTFQFINNYKGGIGEIIGSVVELEVAVTPMSIIVAILVSVLTIFISTFIPALRASRISPIDAIRQTVDVKLTKRKVKTSKTVRKVFGIEAEIGLKNLKRNKRRYQATVFSLIISIILFLSVTFFTQNIMKSFDLSSEMINYDMSVSLTADDTLEYLEQIKQLPDVKEAAMIKQMNMEMEVPIESVNERIVNDYQEGNEKTIFLPVTITVIDNETFKQFAEKIGAEGDKLTEKQEAIFIESNKYEDEQESEYVEIKPLHAKAGEKLPLYEYDYKDDEMVRNYFDDVVVTKYTKEIPIGVTNYGYSNVTILMSEAAYTKYDKEPVRDEYSVDANIYLTSKDPLQTQKDIEALDQNDRNIYNVYAINQDDQQMMVILSIFVYGFITLITLISIANILNTISTSIALRKREFAMLKSIGMTPKGFNKMINYESIFYGIKALIYGLPLSVGAMYLIYQAFRNSFNYAFTLPWLEMIYVVIAVFIIVGISMAYASSKVKKENIIDALKQENI